ncbi:MAG: hypothetical protein ACXWAV_02805 [Chthoniobacterales bacterium]
MNSETFESTYAMLVRSEEKERSLSETAIYLVLILSMFFSVWQVAQMRVTIPENLTAKPIAQVAIAQCDHA